MKILFILNIWDMMCVETIITHNICSERGKTLNIVIWKREAFLYSTYAFIIFGVGMIFDI